MARGYARALYILPFDHRGSFETKMFGWKEPLSATQTAEMVGCIVLGRGEDDRKVREWLGIAGGVPGFIGFAVGRTDFWDPLVAWRAKKATRRIGNRRDLTALSRVRRYLREVRASDRSADRQLIGSDRDIALMEG